MVFHLLLWFCQNEWKAHDDKSKLWAVNAIRLVFAFMVIKPEQHDWYSGYFNKDMLATYNQTPNHIKVTIVGRDRGIRIRFRQIGYFWVNQKIL